jgi:hypothetical protein
MEIISNNDLLNKQFDEAILIFNFNHLHKKRLLNTQKLSEEFCAKYIFCIDDINDGDEDSYLYDFEHIMNTQPHLDENKLIQLIRENRKS